MTFLPIVERELRVAARRPGTYWARLTTALILLFVWVCMCVADPLSSSSSRSGDDLFGLLSGFAFAFALFAGLRGAADCLSSEKREGTLGLLFLTDLKGYDVVLGKLAATSLGAFYGMLAVLPVLAIPLLMGGVTAAAFWRVALVLVNTQFFSLACGMFVSAISRNERKAMGGTLLAILLVAGGLPLAGFGVSESATRKVPLGFLWPSPGFAFFLALTSPLTPVWRSADFWRSLLATHLLSWSMLGLAAWIAPRAWKDKPAGLKWLRWREWWRGFVLGNAAKRGAFRTRLLERNPIFWLCSRERQAASYPWIFLASMGVIWLWGWGLDRRMWSELRTALFLTYALHLFMKAWVLTFACNSLAADRDNGALELLLSTPLTVRELLRGQWLGLRRHFAGPIAAVVFFDLLWLALGLAQEGFENEFFVCASLANLGMFVADLFTLAWVGMWLGIKSKRASQAASATMARVLVLPWLILALVWVLMVFFGSILFGTLLPVPGWFVFPVVWLVIGLGIDFVFTRSAYRNLHSELRIVATRRFSRPTER